MAMLNNQMVYIYIYMQNMQGCGDGSIVNTYRIMEGTLKKL